MNFLVFPLSRHGPGMGRDGPDFLAQEDFACGPPNCMEAVKRMLGAGDDQESFGIDAVDMRHNGRTRKRKVDKGKRLFCCNLPISVLVIDPYL